MSLNYESYPGLYLAKNNNGNLWIQFDHEKETNPFSRKLTVAIIQLAQKIESDDSIKALVFTGGMGRSFCAGATLTMFQN